MADGDGITIEDLLAECAPREARTKVLLRQDLINRFNDLEAELEEAARDDVAKNREAVAPEIAKQIVALQVEIEAAQREFTFRNIGRKPWADLLAKHPPTKAQRAVDGRVEYNPISFPPAAIAASCVAPKLTADQADQFADKMDLREWTKLWVACLEANCGGDSNPKSMLAGKIAQVSAALGQLQQDSESLAASSSAG